MMDYILARSNLTVKVLVRYTSKDRPDKFSDINAPYPYSQFKGSKRKSRYGTGSIIHVFTEDRLSQVQTCLCHLCTESDEPSTEFWRVIVRTATHVVYDDSEVTHTVFECFYDSDDTSVVKKLYGHKILKYTSKLAMDTYLSDLCHIECFTHDKELVQKLSQSLPAVQNEFAVPDYEIPLGIMISHPHGCSKRITLGTVFHLTYPLHQNYPDNVEITKCRLPLFPWSENSEKFLEVFIEFSTGTPFKERLVEDDGNDSSATQQVRASNEIPNNFCPKPGTEFDLPDDFIIALPDNPQFALRYYYRDPNWFNLPPGTKFSFPNGTEVFLPPEAEFFDNGSVSGCCYLTYDTPSCPGSSGSNIIHDLGRHQFRINFPHMGSFKGNINKSGLHYYDLLKRL